MSIYDYIIADFSVIFIKEKFFSPKLKYRPQVVFATSYIFDIFQYSHVLDYIRDSVVYLRNKSSSLV